MITEPFTLNRPKLPLVADADAMGYLGDVTTAAQACRAAFVAAEVGALEWDRERWPDLLFGVWADAEVPASGAGRRRRTGDEESTTELNTWLHLRPTWPQLGGPSIRWPIPEVVSTDRDSRIEHISEAVLDALNTTFHQAMMMSQTLAGTEPNSNTATRMTVAPEVPQTSPALPRNGSVLTMADSERIASTHLPPSQSFTASGFASDHAQVGDVLAALAGKAETFASNVHGSGDHVVVASINHAITPVGAQREFLVTVTATIEHRHSA